MHKKHSFRIPLNDLQFDILAYFKFITNHIRALKLISKNITFNQSAKKNVQDICTWRKTAFFYQGLTIQKIIGNAKLLVTLLCKQLILISKKKLD